MSDDVKQGATGNYYVQKILDGGIPLLGLDINSDKIRIRDIKTPSAANDTGTKGWICWDADFIYVCVDTDTWEKVAIASW